MNRTPFLLASLASLFAAACTDDVAPVTGDKFPGTYEPTTADPGPRPDGPDEVAGCVMAEGVVRFGTPGDDELVDVAIAATGEIVAAGHDRGVRVPQLGLIASSGLVVAYHPDLSGVSYRSSEEAPITKTVTSVAADPAGTIWYTAPLDGTPIVGDVHRSGELHFVAAARDPSFTNERTHELAIGPGGTLAVVGSGLGTQPNGEVWLNPTSWTFEVGDDSLAARSYTTRVLPQAEFYEATDVSLDRVALGGSIRSGLATGLMITARDLDGNLLWERQVSPSASDRIAAVKFLPDGDIAWAATTSLALGEASLGGTDLVIGRLDGATGAVRWTVQHGTGGDDHAADLAIDGEGRVLVVGSLKSDRGDLDTALYALDGDGAVTMTEQWGNTGDEHATAITTDGCGGIVIAGNTTGDFGGTPQGGRDGFLISTRLVTAP